MPEFIFVDYPPGPFELTRQLLEEPLPSASQAEKDRYQVTWNVLRRIDHEYGRDPNGICNGGIRRGTGDIVLGGTPYKGVEVEFPGTRVLASRIKNAAAQQGVPLMTLLDHLRRDNGIHLENLLKEPSSYLTYPDHKYVPIPGHWQHLPAREFMRDMGFSLPSPAAAPLAAQQVLSPIPVQVMPQSYGFPSNTGSNPGPSASAAAVSAANSASPSQASLMLGLAAQITDPRQRDAYTRAVLDRVLGEHDSTVSEVRRARQERALAMTREDKEEKIQALVDTIQHPAAKRGFLTRVIDWFCGRPSRDQAISDGLREYRAAKAGVVGAKIVHKALPPIAVTPHPHPHPHPHYGGPPAHPPIHPPHGGGFVDPAFVVQMGPHGLPMNPLLAAPPSGHMHFDQPHGVVPQFAGPLQHPVAPYGGAGFVDPNAAYLAAAQMPMHQYQHVQQANQHPHAGFVDPNAAYFSGPQVHMHQQVVQPVQHAHNSGGALWVDASSAANNGHYPANVVGPGRAPQQHNVQQQPDGQWHQSGPAVPRLQTQIPNHRMMAGPPRPGGGGVSGGYPRPH